MSTDSHYMRCPRGQAGLLALFAGYLVPGAILGALLLAAPASDLVWAVTSPLPGPAAVSETAFIVLFTIVMALTVLGLWALARRSMRRSLRLATCARAHLGDDRLTVPA